MMLVLSLSALGAGATFAADEIPNPITENHSYGEVARSVGFHPLYIPAASGYRCTDFLTYSGSMADFRYTNGTSKVTVRTAKASAADDDISGIYGAKWDKRTAGNTVVYVAKTGESSYAAHWTSGGYAFSATGDNITEADFMNLVSGSMVDMTEHYFYNDVKSPVRNTMK